MIKSCHQTWDINWTNNSNSVPTSDSIQFSEREIGLIHYQLWVWIGWIESKNQFTPYSKKCNSNSRQFNSRSLNSPNSNYPNSIELPWDWMGGIRELPLVWLPYLTSVTTLQSQFPFNKLEKQKNRNSFHRKGTRLLLEVLHFFSQRKNICMKLIKKVCFRHFYL